MADIAEDYVISDCRSIPTLSSTYSDAFVEYGVKVTLSATEPFVVIKLR